MPFSAAIPVNSFGKSGYSAPLFQEMSSFQATSPSPSSEHIKPMEIDSPVDVTNQQQLPELVPPTPPTSECDDEFPRRRFTIGSVRELGLSDKKIADTGVVALKPALKTSKQRMAQNNALLCQRKQTHFSPTLTLISETDDGTAPMIRTASLGETGYGMHNERVNLREVARIVRRRLSVISEQQDNCENNSSSNNSSTKTRGYVEDFDSIAPHPPRLRTTGFRQPSNNYNQNFRNGSQM